MMTMRCYLPACRAVLVGLAAGRPLPAGSPAFAVTASLLAALEDPGAAADDERAEYAAMTLAAERSVQLLDATDPLDRRRVVVALDAAVSASHLAETGEVLLAAAIPLTGVAAFHVDDVSVQPLVDDALRTPDRAASTVAVAEALARLAQEDLAWYASQELDVLLRGC